MHSAPNRVMPSQHNPYIPQGHVLTVFMPLDQPQAAEEAPLALSQWFGAWSKGIDSQGVVLTAATEHAVLEAEVEVALRGIVEKYGLVAAFWTHGAVRTVQA